MGCRASIVILIFLVLHISVGCVHVQVISTELNRTVVELLQQLLYWQDRLKATSPLQAAKRKRLVSGLRSVLGVGALEFKVPGVFW